MVNWLIDADMFEGYRGEFITAIHSQGHQAKLVHTPSPPYRWEDTGCSYRQTFPSDSCVISHGDIELVTRIVKDRRWIPGAFATVENFFYSTYACHLGKHLLNNNYIMLPFAELSRCKNFLFNTLALDNQIFIRPDSPLKLFTGQIATEETFGSDLEFMGFYEFPQESLVVVSTPKQIVSEWRFVVADKHVVAGSTYKKGDQFEFHSNYDSDALEFAKSIAAGQFQPDPVWVMDICKLADNSYHLLEIGGFSFSDLYGCNKRDVVAAVSTVAERVWKKEQD